MLSVIKATTKIPFTRLAYIGVGCVVALLVIYIIATVINKFCFDDPSKAHWNAHARFTAAAQQQRLAQLQAQQQEARIHVCAPPRMGGAKLNIIYTVGDVPIVGIHNSNITSNQQTHNHKYSHNIRRQQTLTPTSSTSSTCKVSASASGSAPGSAPPEPSTPTTTEFTVGDVHTNDVHFNRLERF